MAVEFLFVADTGDSYAAEAVLGKTAFELNEVLLEARCKAAYFDEAF